MIIHHLLFPLKVIIIKHSMKQEGKKRRIRMIKLIPKLSKTIPKKKLIPLKKPKNQENLISKK